MNTKRRNSDSIKNEPRSRSRNPSYSKKSPKKQIRAKKDKGMYVDIDLHKEFLLATMDNDRKILQNIKVENTHKSIKKHFTDIPILSWNHHQSGMARIDFLQMN